MSDLAVRKLQRLISMAAPHTSKCVYTPIVGCGGVGGICLGNWQCNDGDGCTNDYCIKGGCTYVVNKKCIFTGNCQQAGDCSDDDKCTMDQCHSGKCQYSTIAGCASAAKCKVDGDCAEKKCQFRKCVAGQCLYAPIPGCP